MTMAKNTHIHTMTAEVKHSDAKSTIKKRGKRIGPSNVEAKRAAALRQAANAAEAERRSTGITSTISFIQLIKDAALTGTIPSNPQLIATLQSWRDSAALKAEDLSPTGTRLVQDVKVLTDLVCEFLKERNADGLLQSFLHHVHLAGKLAGVDLAMAGWRARGQARRRLNRSNNAGGRGKISIWKSSDNRQKVYLGGEHSRISGIDRDADQQAQQQTSEQAPQQKMAKEARALLRIAQQLIISTDFRDLIVKIQRIARRVIEVAKMTEDEEGEEEEIGMSEEEEESMEQQGQHWTEHSEKMKKQDDYFDQDLRKLERDEAFTSSNLYGGHQAVYEGNQEQGNLHERRESHEQSHTQHHEQSSHDDQMMGRTDQNIPIPSLKTAQSLPIVERQQQQVEGSHHKKQQPQSHPGKKSALRRQILCDLRGIFEKLAANKPFARALRDFYTVLLKMRQKVESSTARQAEMDTHAQGIAQDLRYDANFRTAQDELLGLLERLTGDKHVSLTPLIENLRKVRHEARNDYQLRDFLGDWRAFLKRCTAKSTSSSSSYLDSKEYMNRGEFLLKRTEEYFSPEGQYRSHLDESFDALNAYIEGLRSDKLTKALGRHINKLVREDLIGIGRGEPLSLRTMLSSSALLRPDLLNDVRFHILPRILQSMQSIPLPRIEVVSGGTVLVLEDLIIPADALVPLQMEILTSSHVTMNPKSKLFRRTSTPAQPPSARIEGVQGGVQLKLSSIAGQVRNVRFTMDRREGWPRFSDQGLADLRIGGRGLSIFIDLASHPASEITGHSNLRSSILPAALIAHHVRVRIDKLTLSLHDSLHDSMYRVFNPIVSSVVKRNMERAIRDQIINVVDSLDGLLDRLSQTVVSQ